jgi:2,3-bisphosphoglycerate-dependent phosphoglycerate mutase
MTKVYFVRHAKPDFSIHDDLTRPLNKEGMNDCKRVTEFLSNKGINKVYSSPYKRAVDTIKGFAENFDYGINMIDDFRERKISNEWVEDFNKFSRQQWADFDYKLSDGESLKEVQNRNIAALKQILKENANDSIAIATHGTALSTIINYYDKSFDYNQFERIKGFMPFIVTIHFDGENMVKIEEFLF